MSVHGWNMGQCCTSTSSSRFVVIPGPAAPVVYPYRPLPYIMVLLDVIGTQMARSTNLMIC